MISTGYDVICNCGSHNYISFTEEKIICKNCGIENSIKYVNTVVGKKRKKIKIIEEPVFKNCTIDYNVIY